MARQSTICDIYKNESAAGGIWARCKRETAGRGADILLNGDEVMPACRRIEASDPNSFAKGYNIIFPTWELPAYPPARARQLERFDEIWAPSKFIYDCISQAVQVPIYHMPWACEPRVTRDLGRRYFEIPENRFTVLFFWDAASYAAGKNPGAVIDVFRQAVERRPLARVQLVLKVNNPSRDGEAVRRLKEELAQMTASHSSSVR